MCYRRRAALSGRAGPPLSARPLAGPGRADVRVPVLRCERLEGGLEEGDRVVLAADHQAIAVGETPDPARDAGVDVADAPLGGEPGALLRIAEVRVAAVDDHVALVEEAEELLYRLLRRVAGRDHQPDGTRGLELADELFE